MFIDTVAVCLVQCVSRTLFGMSLAVDVRCATSTYSVIRRTTHNHNQSHSAQHTTHTVHKTCCHSTNKHKKVILYTWVRASWIEFNNFPTRCDLFSLLHYCRQLYMFRVLTPIIRSWYNCKYSFWYWLTGSTTIRFRCWVGTDSCVSSIRYTCRAAYSNVINWISRI